MRIIYLHQYFVTPDQPGGTRSYEMARRLAARGHAVHMITADMSGAAGPGWSTQEVAGFTVHRVGVAYSNQMGWAERVRAFLAFAVAAARRAAAIEADVIFATSTPLTIAAPALYASWRRGTPFVFEIRDIWPLVPIALGQLRNPVLRLAAVALERLAYRCAARGVALAPGMAEHMIACGMAPAAVTVIPNGCDNDVFGATLAPPALRAEPWLGDRPLVLFAGQLGMASGVGYVVDLARAMLPIDPDIRFVIIGDGREAAAIRARAAALGVLDVNLKMLPAVSKQEVAAWFQTAAATLALFSGPRVLWKDAVQNKFFDALAAGKPVVSNHEGWQNQIAEEHDVGFAVPQADAAAAAAKIARAVRDGPWLAGVRDRALALAAGAFSRDRQAEQLEQVLMGACRRR